MAIFSDTSKALKSGLADIGYGLGLGGFGITQPVGTPYRKDVTPYTVYNQTKGYTFAPESRVLGATTTDNGSSSENLMNGLPQGNPPPKYTPPAGGLDQKPGSNLNIPQASILSPDQKVGGQSQSDLINGEYNNFNSYLDSQVGSANQNFGNTQSAITNESTAAVNDANAQRDIRNTEIGNQQAAGRQNERLNLQKVRQLLQDLEQKNAARIAVTGAGGSTTEALADRFGRTAQQNVGGVLQEGQRVQNDLNVEKTRANQFYDNAIQKIKDTATAAINDARSKLNDNLSAIDSERRASAQQKATARYDAWRSYYDNLNKARIEATNFKTQYDNWLQTKNQELAGAYGFQLNDINPGDYSAYTNQASYGVGSAPSMTEGVGSVAPVTYTGNRKPQDQFDQYGNPITQ